MSWCIVQFLWDKVGGVLGLCGMVCCVMWNIVMWNTVCSGTECCGEKTGMICQFSRFQSPQRLCVSRVQSLKCSWSIVFSDSRVQSIVYSL